MSVLKDHEEPREAPRPGDCGNEWFTEAQSNVCMACVGDQRATHTCQAAAPGEARPGTPYSGPVRSAAPREAPRDECPVDPCPTCSRHIAAHYEETQRRVEAEALLAAARRERDALAHLLSMVTLEEMGGTPDLFAPVGGWETWDEAAREALAARKEPTDG